MTNFPITYGNLQNHKWLSNGNRKENYKQVKVRTGSEKDINYNKGYFCVTIQRFQCHKKVSNSKFQYKLDKQMFPVPFEGNSGNRYCFLLS